MRMWLSHEKPSPPREKQLKDYGVIRTVWPNMFGYYCVFPEEREASKYFLFQQGYDVLMQDSFKLLQRQRKWQKIHRNF